MLSLDTKCVSKIVYITFFTDKFRVALDYQLRKLLDQGLHDNEAINQTEKNINKVWTSWLLIMHLIDSLTAVQIYKYASALDFRSLRYLVKFKL